MNKEPLVLLGGGGHCRSVIDVIELEGKFEIAGIIDKEEKIGQSIGDYNITGSDSEIEFYVSKYKNCLVTIGQIESSNVRKKLFSRLKEAGAVLPIIISPLAHVSKNAFIDEGTVIMHYAMINSGAKIGKNVIINSRSTVEHDSIVKDYCHISTHSVVNGSCVIGEGTFLGSGSVTLHNINIGTNCIVGAGSVVIKPVEHGCKIVGNPARAISSND